MQFNFKIDLGHILTIIVMLVSGLMAFARLSESDALHAQEILNLQQQSVQWHSEILETIKENRKETRDDLESLRNQMIGNTKLLNRLK